MRSIEELRSDYYSCKEKLAEISENSTQKSKEISDLKLKIDHLKPLVEGIERKVNNEIRGHHTITANQFIDLKKQLIEQKAALAELTELLPFHERDLNGLKTDRQAHGRVQKQVSHQIADIFATQATINIAEIIEGDFKTLVNSIQSQSSLLLPQDRSHDDLYRMIGKLICAEVYKAGIPTTQQAIIERNALIESLE